MNIRNVKNSTGIMAGITGLLFALVYVGLEFSQGIPEGISIYGDANTISVWHFPLIWLLAGILFYCAFYAAGTIRGGGPPRIVLVITDARRAATILWGLVS